MLRLHMHVHYYIVTCEYEHISNILLIQLALLYISSTYRILKIISFFIMLLFLFVVNPLILILQQFITSLLITH